MHWKDRWEYEAKKEYEYLLSLSEKKLLSQIEENHTGQYMSIWRAIAKNGTLKNSWEVLWTFIKNHPGENSMLHRYHCSAALFSLMDETDPACKNDLRKEVQWDHDGEDKRQEALLKLKRKIKKLIEKTK